jgi:hypothetical protein
VPRQATSTASPSPPIGAVLRCRAVGRSRSGTG